MIPMDALRGHNPGNPPVVIGLAGGIASGKSSVAKAFASLGWLVIDFDALVRNKLQDPGVQNTLVSWWGASVQRPDGTTDRTRIAEIVFNDDAQRQRLERLVHPLVWRTRQQARDEALKAGALGAVLDAPLLYESGLDRECDAVVFVDAPLEIRARRAMSSRGWTREELLRRESAQIPIEEKAKRSRFTVDNTGDPEALLEQVANICATLLSVSTGLGHAADPQRGSPKP